MFADPTLRCIGTAVGRCTNPFMSANPWVLGSPSPTNVLVADPPNGLNNFSRPSNFFRFPREHLRHKCGYTMTHHVVHSNRHSILLPRHLMAMLCAGERLGVGACSGCWPLTLYKIVRGACCYWGNSLKFACRCLRTVGSADSCKLQSLLRPLQTHSCSGRKWAYAINLVGWSFSTAGLPWAVLWRATSNPE